MDAFALSSALFQRERTGKGQHIDLACSGSR
jgi:crotonobetainyl-CoA:carnitine CoA-transferase CaiB-like acyl-CoA transferase